jgi:hypothetical protein
MLLSTPNESSYSKLLISLLMVAERKSRTEGDKSTNVPDDATVDVL